jgi:hypothetical protein
MKTYRSLLAAALALVGIISSASAATVDFTKLAGMYKATYTLVSGSTNITGPVTVLATVSNNGSKAKLTIFGSANAGFSTIALYGVVVLGPHNKVSSNNILLAYFTLFPASNTRFSGMRSPLRFTLTNGTLASIPYVFKFNGTKLSIVGSADLSGTPLTVSVIGQK